MRRFRFTSLVLLLLLTPFPLLARQSTVISTWAGGGPDNLPALEANLDQPYGLDADRSGNYYIAASGQHRVFKVSSTGVLTLAAGNGEFGYTGDDGPARDATLWTPSGVAVDSHGNLYIADYDNGAVRRVDAGTGVITSILPYYYGFGGVWGIGVDASDKVYFSDYSSLWRFDPTTSGFTALWISGGLAGISVEAGGDVLVCQDGGVFRVSAPGEAVLIAGGGAGGDGGPAIGASLDLPVGVDEDQAGNIYIADMGAGSVRRVDGATGIISTVLSGIVPLNVAVSTGGTILVADGLSNRILRVSSSGAVAPAAGNGQTTFSGEGVVASHAALTEPAIALDAAGNLYIADRSNHRVRRVDGATQLITTVAGDGTSGSGGDGGAALQARLVSPAGVALDAGGNLFIADRDDQRVRRVDAATGTIETVAGTGVAGWAGDGGPASSASLAGPEGLALDGAGNLYIADTGNHRVRRVDAATGTIVTIAGNGVAGYAGDGGPATLANLHSPAGLAVDPSGDLLIADPGNHRIRRVDAVTGVIDVIAGLGNGGDGGPALTAGLSSPTGISIDASGNVYIADTGHQRIRRVDAATGIIDTVAGSGTQGYSGDGLEPVLASLNSPAGVVAGADGYLYIADAGNRRVRRAGVPTRTPVADAGPDQVFQCADTDGTPVTLDGSRSSDPEGQPLAYTWTGPFPEGGGVVTGVNPTVTLQLGTWTLSLAVSDGSTISPLDTVRVTVSFEVAGFDPPLGDLVPVGEPVPLPDHESNAGRTVTMKLSYQCTRASLTDQEVPPPTISAIVSTGGYFSCDPTKLRRRDAVNVCDFYYAGGGNWAYDLSTRAMPPGLYYVQVEVFDGRSFIGAFALK